MSIQQFVSTAPGLSSYALDEIAIFDQDYKQVLAGARPIKFTIKPSSKLMEQPLESGATVSDHRIILPQEIELSLILQSQDYKKTYDLMTQLFNNATLLIVQSKVGIFPNMVMMEMPHEESANMYDALALALKLKQVQFVTSKSEIIPKNPVNKTTVKRGNIEPQQTTPEKKVKSSIGFDAFYGNK